MKQILFPYPYNTQIDESITQTIIEKGTIDSNDSEQEGIFEAYIGNYAIETANNTVESLAKTVAENTVSVIVMIALFIVSRIIVILLKFENNYNKYKLNIMKMVQQ